MKAEGTSHDLQGLGVACGELGDMKEGPEGAWEPEGTWGKLMGSGGS